LQQEVFRVLDERFDVVKIDPNDLLKAQNIILYVQNLEFVQGFRNCKQNKYRHFMLDQILNSFISGGLVFVT
jgi:hypothetical protein